MEPRLIKIDRNGSKHYEGEVTCDRCNGKGYYAIGNHNGKPVLSPHDHGVCWKCGGTGKVHSTWIERTPEYQAKLDARKKAKWEAKWEAELKEREAKEKAEREEREEREAKIKALKAISQHIGTVGDKLEIKVTYVKSGWWEQKSFSGYGTDIMYIHIFKDEHGNVLTWKTQKGLQMNNGELVTIKGTIKNHSEYNDEKQTELTRCKVTIVGE